MIKLDIYNDVIKDYYTSPYDEYSFNTTLRFGLDIPEKILIPKDKQRTAFRAVYSYGSENKGFFRVLNNYFQTNYSLSDRSFAYRKDISISKPIDEALQYKNEGYYLLKVDLSKYFNSVNVDYLNNTILPTLFTEGSSLDFMRVLFSNQRCKYGNEIIEEDLGIQPGNPFSSFLANYILDQLDIKMAEQVNGYLRYSDDILIAGKSKEDLLKYLDILKTELDTIGLSINPNKVEITSPPEPTTFLGVIINNGVKSLGINKKKTFKSLIKHNVKKYLGKKYKDMSFPDKVLNCFTDTINDLFGGLIWNDKSGGIGGFIINNITDEKDHQELNDYLIQEFKTLRTGKHNKKTWSITSLKELTLYGFLDWFRIVKYYKSNKYFFAEHIYRLYFNKCNKNKSEAFDINSNSDCYHQEVKIHDCNSFFNVFSVVINHICAYEQIHINPIEGDLIINNVLVIKGFSQVSNSCKILLKNDENKDILLDVKIQKLNLENFDINFDFLFNLFQGYCLQQNNSKCTKELKYVRPTFNCKYLYSRTNDIKRVLCFNLYLLLSYKQLKSNSHYTVISHHNNTSVNKYVENNQYFIL